MYVWIWMDLIIDDRHELWDEMIAIYFARAAYEA